MNGPERVRSPRDTQELPVRLDRVDADAEAGRLLADYRQRKSGRTGRMADGIHWKRWVLIAIMSLVGTGLGMRLGALYGQPIAGAVALALTGVLIAVVATRR